MNEPTTIEELTTEWVNANADKIRFAAWVRNLSDEQIDGYRAKFKKYKSRNTRCEDAPCCGCCD